jgi:hypothetical protein
MKVRGWWTGTVGFCYGRAVMTGRQTGRWLTGFGAAALLATGCGVSIRELAGFPAESTPSAIQRTTDQQWVLIKNPQFGDRPSEPEYIWVEESKIPTTMNTLVFGKKSLIAPPELVAKYGSPPGGGKISPLQGGPYAQGGSVPKAVPPRTEARPSPSAPAPPAPPPTRGYVVYVDTNRIVIDLTAQDGLRPGSLVSLRRDKIPIVHPVTGELLGELDEEVATAKVTEVRDRFSVAEIQTLPPGTQIKVKDRVTPR